MITFFFLARNQGFDVVLVDTAGRMQDNAPLMTALAKLITVNTPDLVLFVGEALVGNEAVDQLVRAWAWFSSQPQLWPVVCDNVSPFRSSSTEPWLTILWPRHLGSLMALSLPSLIPLMTR